VDLLLVGDDPN